jgi:hypothetical protein
MKNFALALFFTCLFSVCTLADDQGHHHEDLTSAQLGTVSFPVSCAPAVQKPFERGVALLHSFWYEEAEKEFQQIAADDPHCAMAHWGVAMSLWHQLWNHPDAKVIEQGLDEVHMAKTIDGPTTAREKAYVGAIEAFYGNSKKQNHEARAKAYSDGMKKFTSLIPMITKALRSMPCRYSPPSRTMTRLLPIARRRLRFWKSFSLPSPIIRAWRII